MPPQEEEEQEMPAYRAATDALFGCAMLQGPSPSVGSSHHYAPTAAAAGSARAQTQKAA